MLKSPSNLVKTAHDNEREPYLKKKRTLFTTPTLQMDLKSLDLKRKKLRGKRKHRAINSSTYYWMFG